MKLQNPFVAVNVAKPRTDSAAQFSIVVLNKENYPRALRIVIAKIERMFPELGKKSPAMCEMITCASEIANNAAAKEEHFPIRMTARREGSILFFETFQAKNFKNPKIGLPADPLACGGRGLYIVNFLTGGGLHLEGERGKAWFAYDTSKKRGKAHGGFEEKLPLIGD
ncbi:MAG: hypothetical protein N3G22_02965 [Candidatus Micrarchaeota archaeon]|nr:hypothetical protein [Candidatus Micrarchaeota archaeon]